MTPADAAAQLIATDPRFAVEDAVIRGTRFRVFSNAPATLGEMLAACEDRYGPRDCLIYQGERQTYAAFGANVRRLAVALRDDLGMQPGDRVAIVMRNYPELLVAMMAIAAAGGVAVLLNAWWTEPELVYGLEDSGARLIFADGPRARLVAPFATRQQRTIIAVRDAEAPVTWSALMDRPDPGDWPDVPTGPDDDVAVLYSSGSTGTSKGVILTHRGAISAVYSWIFTTEVGRLTLDPALPRPGDDVVTGTAASLIVTPLFHVTASHPVWLQGLVLGVKSVLIHRWDPVEAIRLIEEESITRILGVPTQTADLMEVARATGAALPSLAYVGSGGAKRPAPQVGQLAEAFPHASIASGWGMTETNALGLTVSGADYVARPGSAGRLIGPLQELAILDDDGAALPTGTVGELTVKSPANMRCYLNKPEATKEVLQDGWLRTGDLAHVDDEGFVTIVDRKKNIIIRGGENIAALEVEAAIHAHPDVLEAAAFPVPDDRLGETVGVGVTLRPGSTLCTEALAVFLNGRIAHFKIPEHVWTFDTPLPRGGTDKIERRALARTCLATLSEDQRTT